MRDVITNTDMTLYNVGSDGKYTRIVIKDVFWQESKQSNIEKTGMASSDAVKVFIPITSAPINFNITTGKDLVIKGEITATIDNTSPQTISTSLKALTSSHDVHTVTICDAKLYGGPDLQHYLLTCK